MCDRPGERTGKSASKRYRRPHAAYKKTKKSLKGGLHDSTDTHHSTMFLVQVMEMAEQEMTKASLSSEELKCCALSLTFFILQEGSTVLKSIR